MELFLCMLNCTLHKFLCECGVSLDGVLVLARLGLTSDCEGISLGIEFPPETFSNIMLYTNPNCVHIDIYIFWP